MARKRMFDSEVIDTDLFLDMPQSTRLLYYDLGMRADDDGFVSNPKKIIRTTGANDDDLKLLIMKSFIIGFENGVIVIRHWRLNNYIQKDRYHETIYKDEKEQLTLDENNVYNLYTKCIPSIDKIRLDKIRLDKISSSSIYSYIEENFGRTLSSIEYEEISSWKDTELTRYAIKQAILNGVYNIKYIKAILLNYEKNKIETVQQAQEQEKKRKASKKQESQDIIPEWYGKEIKSNEYDAETIEFAEKVRNT